MTEKATAMNTPYYDDEDSQLPPHEQAERRRKRAAQYDDDDEEDAVQANDEPALPLPAQHQSRHQQAQPPRRPTAPARHPPHTTADTPPPALHQTAYTGTTRQLEEHELPPHRPAHAPPGTTRPRLASPPPHQPRRESLMSSALGRLEQNARAGGLRPSQTVNERVQRVSKQPAPVQRARPARAASATRMDVDTSAADQPPRAIERRRSAYPDDDPDVAAYLAEERPQRESFFMTRHPYATRTDARTAYQTAMIQSQGNIARADLLPAVLDRPHLPIPALEMFGIPDLRRYQQRSWWLHPVLLLLIALLIFGFVAWLSPNGRTIISGWSNTVTTTVQQTLHPHAPTSIAPGNPPGNYVLRAPPSLLPQHIDEILMSYGSPAAGTGQAWYNAGREYGIDPAFAVAFFVHESTAGTAPGWAGWKPDGSSTHNVGNIICAGYPTCFGRFRDYPNWETGIRDWYRLINVEYLQGRGHQTVADIIPVYAPATENNVTLYVNTVQQLVDTWRINYGQGSGIPASSVQPAGNPLGAANTVITQGYGVGTHAPANVWGAIDLALDSTGNGIADPHGTLGKPVYATHSGIVKVTLNSYPAGNHVWVVNDQYRTGYAHLLDVLVQTGQEVRRGTQIGTIGSTGMSSGPHLDYQVWQKRDGNWINVNPMEYSPLGALKAE